ncbi:hypothetical protein WICANDRAFT_51390 [Wickerhamomyces anomalus NRRL Y-366-8]|uniref:NAD-dependent epimerase/dehydratase domain-containing protein n=1 Tax=Wickerhamomyces anomalus (strain ATCC 58044 / CBS 1984 / NCYC 433 / NRRL Y-366-8) TaxID=683960 RepID=A0A1E3P5Z3_WICAA|nr:uncharacterized protein WICANDRAFT_51390 [Wickerhamomyces anomalus NRRL Y-366-8]ODQ60738.1 hypothetical protein WICANDRAFT_51390 [Wickerhamomyces anomalus NRRL Y-366-8]
MKFFVTGATGFIGSALVEELINHGHRVVGLARSESAVEKILKTGSQVIKGDLQDLEALKKGVRESDGVIHLGFIHDFDNFDRSCEIDFEATKAMISELKGTQKPFVWPNGLLGFRTPIGTKTYDDRPSLEPSGFVQRAINEVYVLDAASQGVRSSVVRLAPTVHGAGDHAFIPALIGIAKGKGVSYYIEEGKNTWPAVHRDDAATLIRLVVEKAPAGTAYHASQEEVPSKDIAETIGKTFSLPVKSISSQDALKEMGFFGFAFGVNSNPSTEKARALGWVPKEIGLLEDIEKNYTS